MTADEGKQLFTTRFSSAYPAMYCPAKFPPAMAKIFATNVEVTDAANQLYTGSKFVEHCHWIMSAISRCKDEIAGAHTDVRAQARRAGVVYIDKPISGDQMENKFIEMDAIDIEAQDQHWQAYIKN